MNRFEARDCEVLYVLGDEKGSPEVWLHHIEATVENLATRANLSEGTTTVAVSATLQKSGQLSAFVTADPLQKLDTAHAGHFLVGKDEIDVAMGEMALRGLAGVRREHFEFSAQERRQRGEDEWFVIHHQYRAFEGAHFQASRTRLKAGGNGPILH